jgi:hypothetical protein
VGKEEPLSSLLTPERQAGRQAGRQLQCRCWLWSKGGWEQTTLAKYSALVTHRFLSMLINLGTRGHHCQHVCTHTYGGTEHTHTFTHTYTNAPTCIQRKIPAPSMRAATLRTHMWQCSAERKHTHTSLHVVVTKALRPACVQPPCAPTCGSAVQSARTHTQAYMLLVREPYSQHACSRLAHQHVAVQSACTHTHIPTATTRSDTKTPTHIPVDSTALLPACVQPPCAPTCGSAKHTHTHTHQQQPQDQTQRHQPTYL